jgi:hypothetical protein
MFGRVSAALVLVAALAVLAGATSIQAAPRPYLKLVDLTPLTIAGTNFKTSERVSVIVGVDDAKYVRRLRATPRGTFRVEFQDVLVTDRCNTDVWARAAGGAGSVAVLKRAQPLCPPALTPP